MGAPQEGPLPVPHLLPATPLFIALPDCNRLRLQRGVSCPRDTPEEHQETGVPFGHEQELLPECADLHHWSSRGKTSTTASLSLETFADQAGSSARVCRRFCRTCHLSIHVPLKAREEVWSCGELCAGNMRVCIVFLALPRLSEECIWATGVRGHHPCLLVSQ